MAAVLSNQGGYYHSAAYVSECRRMGLLTVGPDINESEWFYKGDNNRVVIGYMAIKGLKREAVALIEEERKKGVFTSLENVAERLCLAKQDIVQLVASGTFDSLSQLSRSEQLRTLLIRNHHAKKRRQGSLFNQEMSVSTPHQVQTKRTMEELVKEAEVLSFLRNHHILYLYASKIMGVRRIKGFQISNYVDKKVTLIGYPITRRTIITKDNLPMDFISFEDETTLYDVVIFPEVHKKYQHLLGVMSPLIIKGTVKQEVEALIIEVSMMQLLPT